MKLQITMILISAALLGACDKSPAHTDASKPDKSLAVAPELQESDTHSAGNASAKQTDIESQLAMLSDENLSVDSPELSRILGSYFKDGCSTGSEPLTFDRVCEHYTQPEAEMDPSPWPEVIVGIKNNKMVSVVLTSSKLTLGSHWKCSIAKFSENTQICFASNTGARDQASWLVEWDSYFRAAD